MTKFNEWCDAIQIELGIDERAVSVLQTDDERSEIGRNILAEALPFHYASRSRLSSIAEKLGKNGLAKYIRTKMPVGKSMRSGDLGEILATSYIEEETIWNRSVRKLHWKDHREMAMRGDDLLAVGFDDRDTNLVFLKGESKSRVTLRNGAVARARKALNTNSGLPSEHALAFLSDRLYGEGDIDLADKIDALQYGEGVQQSRVSHMIFTFSGNDPTEALTKDALDYRGNIPQFSVGLHVEHHQTFIAAVYKKAVDDGDD